MLYIQNLTTNREIIFNNKDYVLNELDLGDSSASHTTFKGINQVGQYLTNSTIDNREISLIGYILASNATDMKNKKREVYRLLNPLDKFILIRDGYKLECVAESTAKFAVSKSENNDYIAKFTISAICNNPCFAPINDINVNLAVWNGQFHFPMVTSGTGILMGLRTPSTIVTITNEGDITTGIILSFTAKGAVTNPLLLNVNTREQIKINKAMVAGEVITVNTNYGKKAVTSTLNNETTGILNYLDLDSTFLQLAVGDNIFRYDADENVDNLEISVNFNPQYLGV